MIRTYTELLKIPTFEDRLEYLKLNGHLCIKEDGLQRYLNQDFYRGKEWRRIRNEVIIRDFGRDLGMEGYDIYGKIYVHHMNPIQDRHVISHSRDILNPEFLICCSYETHNAIHYGLPVTKYNPLKERQLNDMIPWKN